MNPSTCNRLLDEIAMRAVAEKAADALIPKRASARPVDVLVALAIGAQSVVPGAFSAL